MKKLFTRTYRPLLCALGLGALVTGAAHAAPVPLVVTGYTADVVADGTGAASARTTADFDGASYALMTVGYTNPAGTSSTSGLPASGLITSANTPGLTFQLAAYTANNSLRINTTSGTGTLTVTTPRTAGDIYVLASSGSGVSTMVVTVTFTDGTTQVFPASTVSDWYGGSGAAIIGLGRVSVADNSITNNTSDPRLYEFRYTLSAANISKQVQSVGFSKTSTTGVLNVMGVSANPVCSSAPTAGTATATATNTCASSAIVVSLSGASTDGGLAYQWQSSTNGGTSYTDIAGATSATYTVSGQTTTTLYRARVTCSGTAQSTTSTAVTISSTPPTYATLPVVESFENTWLDVCNTRDVPTVSWRNTPSTGNNSWRREDDGTAGAWVSPASWGYTPAGSQGAHSARFHSGQATNGLIGTLDLYVDLSAAGAKRLSFDFINTSGSDSLVVQLSTNGGTTFSRLDGYKLSTGTGFNTVVLPISATSATSVLRFRGRADFGVTDIGLDNIVLESATGCLTPATLTATTTTTTATLSWLTGGTGTYTVVYGPTGFNPATGGTSVSGITTGSTTITGLTPGTTYQFYVTSNCGAGSNSGTAGPVAFTTLILNDDPCGATQLTISNVCTPINSTTIGATQTPSSTYAGGTQGTGCGSISAPRDVWFQFTTAATGPTSTQVRITVTGGAASVVRAYSGTACAGPLTYISCAGTASNTAAPVLDLTTLSPSTTYYIRVNEYSTTGTLGNFTICASPVPNCPAPTGLGTGTLTNTTAVANWSGTLSTGGTYSVIYGPSGFIPTATGTTISGLTANTATLTGLSPTTAYQFYVQQICGGFNGSSTLAGPFSFTTPLTAPTNDDPCGAVALSSTAVSATNVGSTVTTTGNMNLPACAGGSLPKDVWFAFTANATTSTFTLTGAAAGALRVYTSPSCSAGPFTSVFCQGSGANNTAFAAPVVVSPLVVGQRYYVAVSGFGSSDTPGSFTIAATNVLAARAQTNSNALSVFPNPSNTGQLTLRLNGLGASQATLLNALGQTVRTQALSAAPEHTLTTQGLAAGVYTLRVQAGTEVFTQKVVLE
ncbi:T9SS type A sorting domain-containing protein [Hymenobacter properus]|uniref:Fibronectin type III domain-containing protein n=1 Tax=Hymenobacter properus TaxID=2791026 RepID=A0A931FIS3_9BACT|nr:T9SS type A sorting domain-containing protein [Hymenobacter properus]MBF9141103.1 fibronectin type III domain-containing protein [Hymenobacter properus]MBR7719912.1 fibronectin type III domain-containing protein [Microvirga sp. SRT04]